MYQSRVEVPIAVQMHSWLQKRLTVMLCLFSMVSIMSVFIRCGVFV